MPTVDHSLAGKTALATGGSKGIGRAIALCQPFFLASPAGAFATGSVFVVDGGEYACGPADLAM